MGEQRIPEYRVMLTTDIEAYSNRNDAEQRALQAGLADVLNAAADVAELDRGRWLLQVGGDSVSAILPAGSDLARLMDRFVQELDAELGSYNRRRADEAWTRMRLRLAVHVGPVFLDGSTGWPGQHVVLPVRLRDSKPIRTALGILRSADLAVIVSSNVYRDYITQGPGNPRPTEFRAVLAEGKGKSYTGYLLVPGFDVHSVSALDKYDVQDAASTGTVAEHSPGSGGSMTPEAAGGVPSAPPVSAGRDVIFGDAHRVSGGGSVYRAGRDITLPADNRAGTSDG